MLVVSLHGGSWPILDRWLQAGSTPNLHRFAHDGASGDLHGVLPTLTKPNWATLWTGVSPAEHGVFSRSAIGADGRIIRRAKASDLRFSTWLDRAEAQGRRTLALYAPLTGPSRFSGGAVRVAGDPSGPLKQRFGARAGPRDEQFFPEGGFRGPDDRRAFVRAQIRSLRQTEEEALFLLALSPAELAVVHLLAIDPLLHALWPFADPGHPLFDAGLDAELSEFFRALDSTIGRLIEAHRPSSALLLSDHGFTSCESVVSLSAALLRSRVLELCPGLGPEYLQHPAGTECAVYVDHKAIYVSRAVAGSERTTKTILQTLRELEEPKSGRRPIARAATAEELFGTTSSDAWTVIVVEPALGFSSRVGALGTPLFQPCRPDRDFLAGTHDRVGLWALWGDVAQDEVGGVKEIADIAGLAGRCMGLP